MRNRHIIAISHLVLLQTNILINSKTARQKGFMKTIGSLYSLKKETNEKHPSCQLKKPLKGPFSLGDIP